MRTRLVYRWSLPADDDVLTVREIAALLKVVPATVYAMIERGQLAHFRANNAIRVRRSEIDRLKRGRS